MSISHSWSALPGGFDLTLEILHLGFRPECPAPTTACGKASDIAFCQFGEAEAPMLHLNESAATCLVPGQAVPMFTPIALKTVGGLYFGGSATNTAAVLEYTNTTGFHAVVPREGSAAGG